MFAHIFKQDRLESASLPCHQGARSLLNHVCLQLQRLRRKPEAGQQGRIGCRLTQGRTGYLEHARSSVPESMRWRHAAQAFMDMQAQGRRSMEDSALGRRSSSPNSVRALLAAVWGVSSDTQQPAVPRGTQESAETAVPAR